MHLSLCSFSLVFLGTLATVRSVALASKRSRFQRRGCWRWILLSEIPISTLWTQFSMLREHVIGRERTHIDRARPRSSARRLQWSILTFDFDLKQMQATEPLHCPPHVDSQSLLPSVPAARHANPPFHKWAPPLCQTSVHSTFQPAS